MKLFVSLEQHFVEYQGAIYTDIAFAYPYWQEYLEVFSEVYPIARVRKVTTLPKGWQRADGPNVCFIRITDYLGFWDFLLKMPRVLFDCFKATRKNGCYLLRLGNISTFCWLWLVLRRKQYAFEAVGHAGESVLLVKNVQKFGVSKLIASVNHNLTKIQARKAHCASYVSKYVQSLYPTRNKAKEWIFSGVQLSDEVFASPRKHKDFENNFFKIVSVGRLEPEKGHSILIDALKILHNQGLKFEARIIGPGKEYDELRNKTKELGLQHNIKVCGRIPWGYELFKELDNADLFILPSFSEGMPRALIEAMARGLPGIGSDVGGIKELLSEEYRVPPRNSKALAAKIAEIINDTEQLEMMSRTNFAKAMEYKAEVMNQRKRDFWQSIKRNCC